jgi:tetratricopeptide (TPR) repeat protein
VTGRVLICGMLAVLGGCAVSSDRGPAPEPRPGRARALEGVRALAAQDRERAVALLMEALELCPQDGFVVELLEIARGGPMTSATPLAEVAPPSAPESVPARADLRRVRAQTLREVEVLLQSGEGGQALGRLERLHALEPDDAEVARKLATVLHQQALLYYGQGRLQLALVHWQRVLALQPDDESVKRYVDLLQNERAR